MTSMKRCDEVEALAAPYADGEVGPGERADVARHLEACAPCRCGAAAERLARQAVREHAGALMAEAPGALRVRCASSAPHRPAVWSLRRTPLAIAATLVLAVAGAIVYSTVVNPPVAVAAQLALDHLKCFALFDQPAALDPVDIRETLRSRYGWDVAVPDADAIGDLSLVGGRRCVYLDGSVVHLLYKQGRVPVSVFVLPPGETLPRHDIEALGYAGVAFRRAGRTWVVLAREAPAEVEKLAAAFEAAKVVTGGTGARRSE